MKNGITFPSIGLEHPNVQRVLEIAKEIMSMNKVLDIESLYNLAKRRLKIPRNGLLSIIQFLINKKIIVEGSKFSRDNVLSNFYRKNIYNYIKRKGGVHFSLIKKNVNSDLKGNYGSSGQLIWHLEMLLKFKFIKRLKIGNYTVFMPSELDSESGVLIFLMHDNLNRKILTILNEQDLIKKSDIYKEINERRENVYYRITNLIENDIIHIKEEESIIYINPDKNKVISHILMNKNKYLEINDNNKNLRV
jgi:predicted transcriptional regulator